MRGSSDPQGVGLQFLNLPRRERNHALACRRDSPKIGETWTHNSDVRCCVW